VTRRISVASSSSIVAAASFKRSGRCLGDGSGSCQGLLLTTLHHPYCAATSRQYIACTSFLHRTSTRQDAAAEALEH
jgi:hypothetical protein